LAAVNAFIIVTVGPVRDPVWAPAIRTHPEAQPVGFEAAERAATASAATTSAPAASSTTAPPDQPLFSACKRATRRPSRPLGECERGGHVIDPFQQIGDLNHK
jgi:hypothetical protein